MFQIFQIPQALERKKFGLWSPRFILGLCQTQVWTPITDILKLFSIFETSIGFIE
jgi:hypothetical protein